MRKLGLAIVTLAIAGLVSGGAWAQSAKFAATWSNAPLSVQITASTDNCVFTGTFDPGSTSPGGTVGDETDPCIGAKTEIAEIHVAQNKDLLIGVSGQVGIITITQAKGKRGGITATASAYGGVALLVQLKNQATDEIINVAPGPVILASRQQDLSVTVSGTSTEDIDVLVRLLLKTEASHHFNFIGVDLPQGTYDVIATFDLSAWAEANGFDVETLADAKVTLGARTVTAQEVRAVKDSIVDPN